MNRIQSKYTQDLARARNTAECRESTSLLDALPQHIVIVNTVGVITRVNDTWRRFAARSGHEGGYVGLSYYRYVPDVLRARLQQMLAGGEESVTLEYSIGDRWFVMEARPLPEGAVISHTDITERKRMEVSLEAMACRDPLTQLLNRRGLHRVLDKEVQRSREKHLHALVIDCDNFKGVNDSLGHAAGDLVLRTIAARMREQLGQRGQLARIGGDEFVALLPGADGTAARVIAERLRAAIAEQPIAVSHGPVVVTLSIAVCEMNPQLRNLDDLLATSTAALKSCKRRGKNMVTYRDAPTRCPGDLQVLTSPSYFKALFQPIVELQSGSVVGYEILSRGRGSYASPLDFFRAASRGGLLSRVDLACLRSCANAAASVPSSLRRHINVYPSTLLAAPVSQMLEVLGPQARAGLCLEISEKQILGDPASLRESAQAIRRAGVRFAIDDLGFGRSSLETLICLEPDVLKFDRRLVHGVARDAEKRRALERQIKVAHALETEIIAEGIEEERDRALLLSRGVSLGQGFLFGRPAEAPRLSLLPSLVP